MEKIKNATQLREQKMKLRVKELELEKQIRSDWSEIRKEFRPKYILEKEFGGNDYEHWFIRGFSNIISHFTAGIMKRAETKIESTAEKGIKHLGDRLNKMFSTKK